MFSLICVWIHDWVNNREAGDLRRYRGHYDVTVMWFDSGFRTTENFRKYYSNCIFLPCPTTPIQSIHSCSYPFSRKKEYLFQWEMRIREIKKEGSSFQTLVREIWSAQFCTCPPMILDTEWVITFALLCIHVFETQAYITNNEKYNLHRKIYWVWNNYSCCYKKGTLSYITKKSRLAWKGVFYWTWKSTISDEKKSFSPRIYLIMMFLNYGTGNGVRIDLGLEDRVFMMTSSNGNIVRYWPFVRGIHRSPHRPVTRGFDVFFDLHLE